jgi:hypothetical protein
VCTQRRSVGLKLYHLDIDVVPAIDVGNDFIKIPDRHAGKWITSAPNRHTTIASELNARRNRKFKPLVKLIKAWNQRLPATARLKSFTVETIATRLFHQESFNTLEQGLMKFFDFLAHHTDTETIFDWKQDYGMSFDEIWGIEIPDTAGTGNNVAANIDWTKAQKFLMHGIHTRNKLERADESAYEETAFRHFCKALKIV